MSEEPDDERYAAECRRLVEMLQDLARSRRMSIRSMEKAMGVGDSVFNKVLKGKITLQFRHVLMICDALGIGWRELFAEFYGLGPTPARETDRERILFLVRVGLLTPEQASRLLADLPPAPDLPKQD
ncbi:MAG TPA: helix-turn-helix transcriptional regulator [Thermoanaerobaculia bacterium]